MMIIPESPEKVRNVFAISTPHHLFLKLAWEVVELGKALNPEANKFPRQIAAYHAYNCAITAWHLADWTWQAASADQKNDICKRLEFSQVADDGKTLTRFYDVLTARCPAMRACREIANGSKHMKLRKSDKAIEASADWERVIDPTGFAAIKKGDLILGLTISIDNQTVDAHGLFIDAFGFWENLLAETGFIESMKYVTGTPVPHP